MRKNIVAGNWKMNTTLPEGLQLAKEVNDALKGIDAKCDVIICVPFTHLAPINGVIDQNILGLGAENCADHTSGAYTGEVSAHGCLNRCHLCNSWPLRASPVLR